MKKLSLAGNWKLSGNKISINAQIPGDFHTALLKANKIPDPFYGFNEQEVLWVGQSDWTIKRDFDFEPVSGTKSFLTITEADTFFTVYINDKEAGKGKNQFVRHRFDITKFLVKGKNTIKILFESAEKCSNLEAEKLPYPVPFMKYDVYSPNRNLARKCQCHGGWDWGPCLMVSGIYGDIFIESVSDGLYDYTMVNYEHTGNKWNALIENSYESLKKQTKDFTFSITGLDIQTSAVTVKAELTPGKNKIFAKIPVENPYIWKTSGELKEAGIEENLLYDLEISCNDSAAGNTSVNKKICFSSLKAVSKIDNDYGKPGRCLYFENNGRKIFAKGSNWIPADSLPSRLTEERYYDLLKSAFDGNQNCLRVWGGGIYEKEIFYELCDRLGIIIWQDCMFACSLYPMTEDFLNEVQKEIEYQIPRLQSHACIGLWCGNNENYGALNWFKESNENRVRYLIDYDRLYNGLIGKLVRKIDPFRIYWPSSPCPGPDEYGDNWHSDNTGDMHYWSVWHERKGFEAYREITPRFVSEFGYESFPSLDCIKSFADKSQFNFTSRLMEYHQRSPSGNSIILENFSRYFQFPNGFENMLYLSQVQQAMAIKTAVDWWRSLKPHCMGSIIWQLNDIWPGPSWSSLEYSGKWKLMHYESKKFFDNVYMPLFLKDEKITCVICNDLSKNLKGTVKLSIYNFDGKLLAVKDKSFIVKGDSVKTVINTASSLKELKNTDEYFIYAEGICEDVNGKIYKCENTVFSKVYKHCNILKTNITKEIREDNGKFLITLNTDKPAFFVSLDTNGIDGRFDTNMLTLLPEDKKTISFTPSGKLSLKEVEKGISVKDLRSSY